MKYLATFYGREVGAIGVFSTFHDVPVKAENEDAARLKLYETHEHISNLRLEPQP